MTLRLNRRHFSTAAIAAPAAMALSTTFAAQTDSTPAASPVGGEAVVGITSSLEEWTAAAGEPTPVGDDGTMFQFVSPIDGATPVTVAFTDDRASFMEYNYGAEGPGQEDAYGIVQASIPIESERGEHFLFPAQEEDSSHFTAQVHTLPSAPNSVILSVMALGALEAEEAQVMSISLSLPNVEGTEHAATGDPGGIGLTRDEFISIYGEPAEGGAEVDNYPGLGPDGMNISTTSNPDRGVIDGIYVTSSEGELVTTTWDNALAFTGGSVPEDSVVGQYFTLPATEGGPIGLDVVLWTSPMLQEQMAYDGSVLSMLYLTGDGVIRIDLAMNSEI